MEENRSRIGLNTMTSREEHSIDGFHSGCRRIECRRRKTAKKSIRNAMTNHRRIESKKKKIKVETASIVPGTPVDSFRVIGCCDFRSKRKRFSHRKGTKGESNLLLLLLLLLLLVLASGFDGVPDAPADALVGHVFHVVGRQRREQRQRRVLGVHLSFICFVFFSFSPHETFRHWKLPLCATSLEKPGLHSIDPLADQ